MHANPGYVILWILLLLPPIAAGWRRRWWPFAIYALGCIVFLVEVNRGNDGWDDLADIATLIVIVLPIYAVGTIVWLSLYLAAKYRKRNK